MSYEKLLDGIEKIRQIDSNFVIEKNIGSKKIFLLNPEKYTFADISLEAHSICNKKNEEILNSIVEEMKINVDFRNFICCNLQDFLSKNIHNFKDFIDEHDVLTQGNLKSIFRVGVFGFLDPKRNINIDDEEKKYFFKNITEYYLRNIKYLNGTFDIDPLELDFKKHIMEPILKLIRILNLPQDKVKIWSDGFIEIDAEQEMIQYFLTGLQLHIFYEHFINSLIEESIDNGEIIRNPVIFINPQYNSRKRKVQGYMEFDGFVYITQNQVYFIECKNSHVMDFSYVSQFMQKCNFIERIYEVVVQ